MSQLLDAAPAAAPLLWGAPHSLKSRHQAVVVVVESLWPNIAQRLATSTLSTQIKSCLSCQKISDFTHSVWFFTSVWTLFLTTKPTDQTLNFLPDVFGSSRPLQCDRTSPHLWLVSLSLHSCHRLSSCFSPGAKERNIAPQLTDIEIPTSFWYELKNLTDTLMDYINRESAFIQTECM